MRKWQEEAMDKDLKEMQGDLRVAIRGQMLEVCGGYVGGRYSLDQVRDRARELVGDVSAITFTHILNVIDERDAVVAEAREGRLDREYYEEAMDGDHQSALESVYGPEDN